MPQFTVIRCLACQNTLDQPGQTECEQCHTKLPSYESSSTVQAPQNRAASPIDLTRSSPDEEALPSRPRTPARTGKIIIEIPDSSPIDPTHRTASSSPLLPLTELFAKYAKEGAIQAATDSSAGSGVKKEEADEIDLTIPTPYDAWATKPRPQHPSQLQQRPSSLEASRPNSAPPTPTVRPRVVPYAMTIAGRHQADAARQARKEAERPNAGDYALSQRGAAGPSRSSFGSSREVVRIALFQVRGYYADLEDQELDPPFLTPCEHRVLGTYTCPYLSDCTMLTLS